MNSHQQELLQKELVSWGNLTFDKQKAILTSLKEELKLPESVPVSAPVVPQRLEPVPDDSKKDYPPAV
ncbi:MAG: hypothetical protein GY702_16850 [Desulfobulbaceae bacterium]|nr:hypothetical protein [Desulfobulbaceae bacterium]